jgi:hypothetical protein
MWIVPVQDCINFCFPGFKTMRCEPITKLVCFLAGPFTLKEVNSETIVAEAMDNVVKKDNMSFP